MKLSVIEKVDVSTGWAGNQMNSGKSAGPEHRDIPPRRHGKSCQDGGGTLPGSVLWLRAVFGPAGDDGVTENPSDMAQGLMSNAQCAPFSRAPENGKQFFRRGGVDKALADVSEEVSHNADDRLLVGASPLRRMLWRVIPARSLQRNCGPLPSQALLPAAGTACPWA